MNNAFQFIVDILASFVNLSLEMAPYLLFGFLIAGILHVYFPEKRIHKYMGKRGLKSSVNAALIGVPLPLCSCGVIPTGIALHQKGASKGSTLSFFVSTPQTGVDSILVTYSLLGLPFALLRPIIAFITGVAGGWIVDKNIEQKNTIPEIPKPVDINKTNDSKWLRVLKYAFIDFMNDISKWLIIGLFLAALIDVIVPDDFFSSAYLSNPLINMIIVLAASIPVYVCATGSVPIAAVLFMKGLSPGAILVFLMAGPATNLASITVIGKTIGKQFIRYYLGVIIVGSLVFGMLLDWLFPDIGAFSVLNSVHTEHHVIPFWLSSVSSVVLGMSIILAYIEKKMKIFTRKEKHTLTADKTVIVGGMTCNHCKMTVENNLNSLDKINSVSADIGNGHVQLSGEGIDLQKVKEKLDSLGYKYEGEI